MPQTYFQRLLLFFVIRRAKRILSAFIEDTKRPAEAQERILLEKIRRNEYSQFGRDHGFSEIRSLADFRKNVEISDYQHFQHYIDRVRDGDKGALFGPGEKLIMFSMTSGTTGAPKYIPVTKSFLREYQGSSLIWAAFAYLDHKDFIEEKILPVVSSMRESYTRHGVPCGAMSGLHAQSQHYLGRSLYAVPSCVFDITDAEAKYYALMRLASEQSVGYISSPNPSTVITIARILDNHKALVIRDVYSIV